MRQFSGFGFEKFPACRRVVVEIAHLDEGALRQRSRFRQVSIGCQAPGMGGACTAADERQAGNRGDRSQCFAAETKRADMFKIVERGDFGSGMAGKRQCQFILGDAGAVIRDPNQFDAALFELYLQGCTAGIERIFQQLLEYGSRTFNDFACGNLTDERIGQAADGRERGRR